MTTFDTIEADVETQGVITELEGIFNNILILRQTRSKTRKFGSRSDLMRIVSELEGWESCLYQVHHRVTYKDKQLFTLTMYLHSYLEENA